jgi:hypothetical protein
LRDPPSDQKRPSPIEQLFAKLKALLRKAAARAKDELWHPQAGPQRQPRDPAREY